MVATATNHNESQRLTKAQRAALGAWLSCKSQAEVARHIGTTKATVTRWLRQPRFADTVFDLERSATEEARQVVIASQVRAVEVLREQMDDGDARIRQSAAVHLLKLSGLYNERVTQDIRHTGEQDSSVVIQFVNDWRNAEPTPDPPKDTP